MPHDLLATVTPAFISNIFEFFFLTEAGYISLLVIVCAAVFYFISWMDRRREKCWRRVGESRGLRYDDSGSYPKLGGTINGVTVVAEVIRVQKNYAVRVTARPSTTLPEGLFIRPEGLFQKVGKALGGEDIQVGDLQLDKRYIFQGQDPIKTRELIKHPAVKDALLSLQKHTDSMRVEQGVVYLREPEQGRSEARLTRYIDQIVAIAAAFDKAASDLAKPDTPPALPPEALASNSGEPGDWW